LIDINVTIQLILRLILGFEDIFRVAAKAVLALVIKRIPDTLHFVYIKKHHNLHYF